MRWPSRHSQDGSAQTVSGHLGPKAHSWGSRLLRKHAFLPSRTVSVQSAALPASPPGIPMELLAKGGRLWRPRAAAGLVEEALWPA